MLEYKEMISDKRSGILATLRPHRNLATEGTLFCFPKINLGVVLAQTNFFAFLVCYKYIMLLIDVAKN